MMDRYDELMLGLYRGSVPDWLPTASRELYLRESLRRRCALGQTLVLRYGCTLYCAQALYSPDFAADVYATWTTVRGAASNVTTGLYLALDEVLRGIEGSDVVQELLHFEALAVVELREPPRVPQQDPEAVRAAGLGAAEVYRFRFAVPEIQARMRLYAGASAPAAFVHDHVVAERPTFVARRRMARGWSVDDVTDRFEPEPTVIGGLR